MAVKTITIDMEAYNLLASEKGRAESFSRVIKRKLGKTTTASRLLAHLDEVSLGERTLDRLEEIIEGRDKSPATSPKL